MALAATKWVEMNGREWEGCCFVCVVHSITLMKNAGKLPPFKMLVRLSCLCFIFGCYHGYWWEEMKTPRWREVDRWGGGRNRENNLASQASGKIYVEGLDCRSRCIYCIFKHPLWSQLSFWIKLHKGRYEKSVDLLLCGFLVFLLGEDEKVRNLPSNLSFAFSSCLALAKLFNFWEFQFIHL